MTDSIFTKQYTQLLALPARTPHWELILENCFIFTVVSSPDLEENDRMVGSLWWFREKEAVTALDLAKYVCSSFADSPWNLQSICCVVLRAGVWPQLGAGWNCALLDWLQSGALGRPALQPSQHRPTLNILHSYNTAGTVYSIWYFDTTCLYNTETQNTTF